MRWMPIPLGLIAVVFSALLWRTHPPLLVFSGFALVVSLIVWREPHRRFLIEGERIVDVRGGIEWTRAVSELARVERRVVKHLTRTGRKVEMSLHLIGEDGEVRVIEPRLYGTTAVRLTEALLAVEPDLTVVDHVTDRTGDVPTVEVLRWRRGRPRDTHGMGDEWRAVEAGLRRRYPPLRRLMRRLTGGGR